MQKKLYVYGVVVMAGILLFGILAYEHSFKVSEAYDQRMRRDIQELTQDLTQSGMSVEQVKAFRSVLLDVNRHTESFVTSEVFNIVGAMGGMGIVIMSFSLALAGRVDGQKKEDGCGQ